MSLETLRPSPAFRDVLPVEYKDLVEHGPYTNRNGKDTQTVKAVSYTHLTLPTILLV